MYRVICTDTMSVLSLRQLALLHQQWTAIPNQFSQKTVTVPSTIYSHTVWVLFVLWFHCTISNSYPHTITFTCFRIIAMVSGTPQSCCGLHSVIVGCVQHKACVLCSHPENVVSRMTMDISNITTESEMERNLLSITRAQLIFMLLTAKRLHKKSNFKGTCLMT